MFFESQNPGGPAGFWRSLGGGLSLRMLAQTPAISYRAHPGELTSGEIVAEIFWMGDAVTWPGPLGDHCRTRAAALRAELRKREPLR